VSTSSPEIQETLSPSKRRTYIHPTFRSQGYSWPSGVDTEFLGTFPVMKRPRWAAIRASLSWTEHIREHHWTSLMLEVDASMYIGPRRWLPRPAERASQKTYLCCYAGVGGMRRDMQGLKGNTTRNRSLYEYSYSRVLHILFTRQLGHLAPSLGHKMAGLYIGLRG
jgi:hypothetical protein